MAMFNVLEFGAVGDGKSYDTAAIQKAIDACHSAGGGTVLLPAGRTFLSGTIELRSCVELRVERGARLLAGPRIEDFTAAAFPRSPRPGHAFLVADDAHDIAVTGGGVLDGQALAFMDRDDTYIYRGKPHRPHFIRFKGCRNVAIRDVTIRDTANWAVHLSGCEFVFIHGIRLLNDLKVPNCDGIDPDHCRNVHISDCYIQAGDDCIVIKNRAEAPDAGPSENITIANCVLMSTSTAVKIGTESVDDFRNIVVNNCIIRSSNRGLSIQLRDQGNVENVLFSNCLVETRHFDPRWWGRAEPIYVTAIRRAPGSKLGKVRNVRFSNIICRSENGAFIAGSADSLIEDVLLENVRIELDKWSKWPGGQHDRRPCMSPDTSFGIAPEKDAGLTRHTTAGVFIEHAKGATLRNVEVAWGANRPDYFGPAMEAHFAPGLKLENFSGEAAHPELHKAQLID